MAIDSTLFAANLPAASYTVGQVIPLKVIRGPAIVRDGYGTPLLKRVFALTTGLIGHVTFKNSNWVDEVSNVGASPGVSILSNNSNAIQSGHDCPLIPNSGWEVNFVVDAAATTTVANDAVAMIDIDYPQVQAVKDPKTEKGTPCSTTRRDSYTVTATGSSESMVFTSYNVDFLKAGCKYLLDAVAFRGAPSYGFFSISGAAGQAGLERIIPVLPSSSANLRYVIDYATPLVKGPFNINYAAVGTAGTDTAALEIDWVKR